ncbi:MAG: hypothetical protein IJX54_02105, partial [Oscillospiraceae bacterium]|nr:hypothetical protein [Oscillospiraceae bacterium]
MKTVKSDGRYFDVLVNVKDTGNDNYVYDMTLKEADSLPSHKGLSDGNSSASFKHSISPLPEKVNRGISSLSQEELKSKQLDIILKNNPANNAFSTWIRDVSDIKTFEETLQDSDWDGWEEGGFDPDYTPDMVKQALESGNITV